MCKLVSWQEWNWFTMLKVCADHRTCIKVYRSPHREPLSLRSSVTQGNGFDSPLLLYMCRLSWSQLPRHHTTAVSGGVYDVLQTNGDLHGAVMWREWHDLAVALSICILMLPIQKAHVYTHTHTHARTHSQAHTWQKRFSEVKYTNPVQQFP